MWKRSIQGFNSTNCMALLALLNSLYSGMVARKPASAPISAITRASRALRSEPLASTTSPAITGIQIERLSQGALGVIDEFVVRCVRGRLSRRVSRRQHHERGQQHADPDDHGEGVVVDV